MMSGERDVKRPTLSVEAEKRIWKMIKEGGEYSDLVSAAEQAGLPLPEAQRVIGEMQVAQHLIREAKKEPWHVRWGFYVGFVAMALGAGAMWHFWGAESLEGGSRYDPRGYALWAFILGAILVVRGWGAGRL